MADKHIITVRTLDDSLFKKDTTAIIVDTKESVTKIIGKNHTGKKVTRWISTKRLGNFKVSKAEVINCLRFDTKKEAQEWSTEYQNKHGIPVKKGFLQTIKSFFS